jgi:hypothetical protein
LHLERERQRRLEAKRREQERIKQLFEQAASWRRAADVRAYVGAVRQAINAGRLRVAPAVLDTWALWATEQANRIDPLMRGCSFFEEQASDSAEDVGDFDDS